MKAKLFLKNNMPTILTCVGTAGVIGTAVTAVQATPKAIQLLEEAKQNKGEELTTFEKVQATYKVYIPSVLIGVSTIGCISGAHILNKRQQASLLSAYTLLNTSYKQYKDKVIDLLGEEANDEIQAEVAKDNYKESNMAMVENEELFYDAFSGRYFKSTKHKVQEAEYRLNRDMVMRDYAYLNEWYEYIGLDSIDSGWKLGWSTGMCIQAYWQEWIDFNHTKVTMDDGLECTIVKFWQEPLPDFEEYS